MITRNSRESLSIFNASYELNFTNLQQVKADKLWLSICEGTEIKDVTFSTRRICANVEMCSSVC